MCMYERGCCVTQMHEDVRRQLVGASPLCGWRGLNSGHQASIR